MDLLVNLVNRFILMQPRAPLVHIKPAWLPLTAAIFLLASCLSLPIMARQAQLDLPRESLQIGMHRLQVQVASQHAQRQTGLMYRQHLPEHEGMLFVFPQAAVQCFWMKNTLIPLSAAFIQSDGSIVNIVDMQPLDERSHCSDKPVTHVLEVNQGWFAKRNVRAGNKISSALFEKASPVQP